MENLIYVYKARTNRAFIIPEIPID